MADVSFETAKFLMAEAEKCGHEITRSLLKRWYAWGLLPQFTDQTRQKGAGKPRGSMTIHPTGTLPQLLRLLEIRAAPQRFNPAQTLWRLWWEGWLVDPSKIALALERAATAWRNEAAQLWEDDGPTERGWDFIDAALSGRLPKPLSRIRKRTGRDLTPTVHRLVLSVIVGAFTTWEDVEDPEILYRSLGMDGLRHTLSAEMGDQIDREIAQTLASLSAAIAPIALVKIARTVTHEDLEAVRGDLHRVAKAAGAVWPAIEPLVKRSNAWRDHLDLKLDTRYNVLPLTVLCWLAIRHDPKVGFVRNWLSASTPIVTLLAQSKTNGPIDEKPPRR